MNVVLPDGWRRLPIAEIADFGSGDPISVAKLSRRSGLCPIPVFGGNGIAGYTSLPTVYEPTVILGRVGQKCGVVYRNVGPAWITDNALYARRFRRAIDVRFLALALEAARLNEVKNKNDLPLITQSILNDVKIAWPESREEQRSIADAVSDADDMIASLERLVAKKRDIKQGLMQELLSGRSRLAGFTDEWGTRRLGDLGSFVKGRGIKRDQVRRSGVPCIRYGELYTTYVGYTASTVSFVDEAVASEALPIRRGDVLFAGSGETKEEIGICVAYVGAVAAVAGGDVIVLRGRSYDAVFLATLLNTPPIAAQKSRVGQGDAVVHIHARTLAEIVVTIPSVGEQAAIAQVLIDADAEIEALDRRLDIARSVKQGMMQELLTGRTRLPVTEVAA